MAKKNLREREPNTVIAKELIYPQPGEKYDMRDFQTAFNSDDGLGLLTFEYESDESKFDPIPGCWNVDRGGRHPFEIDDITIFPTPTMEKILCETNMFIENLDLYEKLNIVPKRGILIGSPPGVGKSTAIAAFCRHARNLFDGKVSIMRISSDDEGGIWPSMISSFSSFDNSGDNAAKFIVVIIEDIGGTTGEMTSHHHAMSDLLNFLDGAPGMFPAPTLILATTNYLENLQENIIDRPGRFDSVFELELPSIEDRQKLVELWMKKLDPNWSINDAVKLELKKANPSPAHIKEMIVRHRLHKISLEDAIKSVNEQSKKAKKKEFVEKKSLGF